MNQTKTFMEATVNRGSRLNFQSSRHPQGPVTSSSNHGERKDTGGAVGDDDIRNSK